MTASTSTQINRPVEYHRPSIEKRYAKIEVTGKVAHKIAMLNNKIGKALAARTAKT